LKFVWVVSFGKNFLWSQSPVMKNEGQLMDMKEKVEEQDKEATASSELSMKNEVVEPETALEMTRAHGNSQLSQTSLDQNASTLESMIERYEEEMKKAWEDQQTSSMKKILSQMLGAREEVEEQESEKDNQRIPNSSEAEKYMKEKSTEPPLQETLDENKNYPTKKKNNTVKGNMIMQTSDVAGFIA